MSRDRDALMAAVLADLDDDLARMAYADSLMEGGSARDHARGQFIQFQINEAGAYRLQPLKRIAAKIEADKIFPKYKNSWTADETNRGGDLTKRELNLLPEKYQEFRRGFLYGIGISGLEGDIYIDPKEFAGIVLSVLEKAPTVQKVKFADITTEQLAALPGRNKVLERIKALNMGITDSDETEPEGQEVSRIVEAIKKFSKATSLHMLGCTNGNEAMIRELVMTPEFKRIKRLQDLREEEILFMNMKDLNGKTVLSTDNGELPELSDFVSKIPESTKEVIIQYENSESRSSENSLQLIADAILGDAKSRNLRHLELLIISTKYETLDIVGNDLASHRNRNQKRFFDSLATNEDLKNVVIDVGNLKAQRYLEQARAKHFGRVQPERPGRG